MGGSGDMLSVFVMQSTFYSHLIWWWIMSSVVLFEMMSRLNIEFIIYLIHQMIVSNIANWLVYIHHVSKNVFFLVAQLLNFFFTKQTNKCVDVSIKFFFRMWVLSINTFSFQRELLRTTACGFVGHWKAFPHQQAVRFALFIPQRGNVRATAAGE